MEKAILTFSAGEPFHCPFCGIQTIPPYDENKSGEFKLCKHLVYIGTSEGGFGYINDKYKDIIDNSMDEDDLIQMELNNAVHFSLCAPPPSSFGSYICYQP